MTLAMAWIRTVGDFEELVFASDSRLRFGCAWDSCQKVFPLPRGDCALTFAGDTKFAYPFVHAAINAISLHRGSNRRQVDLIELKSVLLNAINAMMLEIRDLARGKRDFDEPEIQLLFGGYSWRKKRFYLWKFHFNNGQRAFREVKIGPWKSVGTDRRLAIIGDPDASYSSVKRAQRLGQSPPNAADDVAVLAKSKFLALMRERGLVDGRGLNLEPLEVLCEILKTQCSPNVGGAPQVVKVYQHLNAQPFGVRWPDSKGRVAVLGRLLPVGEKMHIPVLSPDTLSVEREHSDRVEVSASSVENKYEDARVAS